MYETWQKDMLRQGDRYANLVRWQLAAPLLSASGFQPSRALLPIPLSMLNSYPGMTQNAGY